MVDARAQIKPPYKVGDIIRHTGAFLRSVGLVVGAPINGEAIAVESIRDGSIERQLLTVRWSDGTESGIAACNIEFCPRGRALTAQRRAGP